MKYLFYSVLAICITVLLGLIITEVESTTLAAIIFAICSFAFVVYLLKRIFNFFGW